MRFEFNTRQSYLFGLGICRFPEVYSQLKNYESTETILKEIKNRYDGREYTWKSINENEYILPYLLTLTKGGFSNFLWHVCNSETENKIIHLIGSIVDPGWNFNARWRTTDSVALANEMYNSEDFSGMPILADALQEAGCAEEDLLARMRDSSSVWCCASRIIEKILQKR